jgi:hypothetical protein
MNAGPGKTQERNANQENATPITEKITLIFSIFQISGEAFHPRWRADCLFIARVKPHGHNIVSCDYSGPMFGTELISL